MIVPPMRICHPVKEFSVIIPVLQPQSPRFLGCKVSSLPLKHLGLLLKASYKAKSIWDNVVKKIEHRLASWKMTYLSRVAGLPLLRAPFPIYQRTSCLSFPFLLVLQNRMEKLHQDFLWVGIGEEFKFHLVSWSKVCSPISEGGLGIQNLRMFNHALLRKWLWCYVHERGV
jgi:hypothetical protein